MENLVVEPAVEQERHSLARKNAHSFRIVAAWTAMLLLSQLPWVIARNFLGTDIPWLVPAWIGAALLFYAASRAWPALRPLGRYFLIMALVILLSYVVTPALLQSTAWKNAFDGKPVVIGLLGSRVLFTLEALLVLAALALSGLRRKEMFQVPGDMNAPVEGIRLPGSKRPLRWMVFGTLMAVLLGGLFAVFMMEGNRPLPSILSAALPWLPLILLSAAGNAFIEEVMYRAAPVALLEPVLGANHALWLTSIWFGLGHFYGGIPSGYAGFVMSGLLGLLLGRAMLDTRGMGWPMVIHIVMDTVIFIFLAGGV